MIKPEDVGKVVEVTFPKTGHYVDKNVKVLMHVKGPKGELYIYHKPYYEPDYEHMGQAIKGFMEFNNGVPDLVCPYCGFITRFGPTKLGTKVKCPECQIEYRLVRFQ